MWVHGCDRVHTGMQSAWMPMAGCALACRVHGCPWQGAHWHAECMDAHGRVRTGVQSAWMPMAGCALACRVHGCPWQGAYKGRAWCAVSTRRLWIPLQAPQSFTRSLAP